MYSENRKTLPTVFLNLQFLSELRGASQRLCDQNVYLRDFDKLSEPGSIRTEGKIVNDSKLLELVPSTAVN